MRSRRPWSEPASTRRRSATSTWAPPTRRARTTATPPGWRRFWPGLPAEVPGVTVNRLCASGLEAVNQASRALRLGEGDLYLAGGAESMSRAPWVVPKPEAGLPRGPQTMHDTALGWRLVNPRMAERYSTESMGETAENVAERYGIAREEQDRFALQSHARAVAASAEGRFADELVPVEAPSPDGGDPVGGRGRRGTARRHLAREARPPAAGVSRGRHGDGRQRLDPQRRRRLPGARLAERAEALGARPLARIVSIGVAGVDPAYMGMGPVPAIRRALDAAGLALDDDRPDRDQRGVRRPGPRLRRRARDRGGAAERERRGDRPRPPARLLRRPAS